MQKSNLILTKILLLFLVSGLGILTCYYKEKSAFVQQQLTFVQDSLTNILSERDAWINGESARKMGLVNLDLGDSLIELHRITWVPNNIFVVQAAVYLDSTVILNYKMGEMATTTSAEPDLQTFSRKQKSANTTQHALKLVLVTEKTKRISYTQWQDFNQKMSKVSFLDAIKNEDYTCCITTGTLQWEAIIAPDTRLKHATWCRQSVEFAEACESVLQFFDDPKLNTALKNARQ